jgi:Fe2+ transport system protein FeoA
MKLRIMELGILPGERIRIEGHHLGLWVIAILDHSNRAASTIAMREEEVLGIIVK